MGAETMDASGGPLRLLLVEDSILDARLLRESLKEMRPAPQVELTHVVTLQKALDALHGAHFDCVLLDLHLPDAHGVGNVDRIRAAAPREAIVVTTGLDDETAALAALKRGAQDYVVKGRFDGSGLLRAVRHAMERNRLLADLDRLREQQYFMASHDGLTGLPNRALFSDRAQRALAAAQRDGRPLAICWVDLDGFKAVNDRHGHAIGDTTLVEVSKALLDSVRKTDTVARFGGDEFVVLLTTVSGCEEAETVAQRMVSRVGAIREIEGKPVEIGASVGVALYPEHGRVLDQLLSRADRAMYAAKQSGKGTLSVARLAAAAQF